MLQSLRRWQQGAALHTYVLPSGEETLNMMTEFPTKLSHTFPLLIHDKVDILPDNFFGDFYACSRFMRNSPAISPYQPYGRAVLTSTSNSSPQAIVNVLYWHDVDHAGSANQSEVRGSIIDSGHSVDDYLEEIIQLLVESHMGGAKSPKVCHWEPIIDAMVEMLINYDFGEFLADPDMFDLKLIPKLIHMCKIPFRDLLNKLNDSILQRPPHSAPMTPEEISQLHPMEQQYLRSGEEYADKLFYS